MKKRIIFTIFLVLAIFIITAGADSAAVELDASDVNCRECHADPHVIHSDKNVQCQNCHGQTLEVKIPRCTACHNGPIHDVHKKKVEIQPCSSCHLNIQGKHNSLLGDSICEHCHKDLIKIHGGELEACNRCHGSVQKITKPDLAIGMTVVCENCHQSDSIATIHGSKDDAQTCYRCHREGVEETETVKIPHIIHLPNVDCMTCHWDLTEDSIVVPKCSKCHEVDRIHAFSSIGKKMKGSVECNICHPGLSIQQSMGEVTDIPGSVTPAEETTAVPTSTPPIPGFGAMVTLAVLGLLNIFRTRK